MNSEEQLALIQQLQGANQQLQAELEQALQQQPVVPQASDPDPRIMGVVEQLRKEVHQL